MPFVKRHNQRVDLSASIRKIQERVLGSEKTKRTNHTVARIDFVANAILNNPEFTASQIREIARRNGFRPNLRIIEKTRSIMAELGFDSVTKAREKNSVEREKQKIRRKIFSTKRRRKMPKVKLTAKQKILLSEAIEPAFNAIDYLEKIGHFSNELEKEEYKNYVLQRLPNWVAIHDPKKAKLTTHITTNTKLALRTFKRYALSNKTGLTIAATNALSEVLNRQRHGKSVSESLKAGTEKKGNATRFSEKEMEIIWRVHGMRTHK